MKSLSAIFPSPHQKVVVFINDTIVFCCSSITSTKIPSESDSSCITHSFVISSRTNPIPHSGCTPTGDGTSSILFSTKY